MASLRIHEDQENTAVELIKDNADTFSVAQRRALGDLSQFVGNQNLPGLTNGPCQVQDENCKIWQFKHKMSIVPPVDQFRAFNVYEDKPTEAEIKKSERTVKPFVAKELKGDNFFANAAENVRSLCAQVEKQQERAEEAAPIRLPFQNLKVVAESPMSVADSSVLSIPNNESQIVDNTVEEDDDKTIAQTDREMFFHVAEYRQDIYEYMREIEEKHRASPRYMRKQPDITHIMRSILVDWLVEVCDEYKQQSETLHLAVSYVDRFLSYMSVVRTKLQLLGTAATYIAAKFEEVYPPEVTEFVYITDDTYTKREVLRMEHLILRVLSFDLSTPTSLAFLSHYCISNGLSKKTFHLAAYIAELCLLEADPYLQYKPSIIAASALATARHCLLCETCGTFENREREIAHTELTEAAHCAGAAWPAALATCSGYTLAELRPCLREMARTHAHAFLQPYQAIPDKYRGNIYDGVSTIEARPMFPVSKYQPAVNTNNTKAPAETARTS